MSGWVVVGEWALGIRFQSYHAGRSGVPRAGRCRAGGLQFQVAIDAGEFP